MKNGLEQYQTFNAGVHEPCPLTMGVKKCFENSYEGME